MGLTCVRHAAFSLNGSYVVCNGDVGFEKQREELKKEGLYTFESDSDCEILLPLYRAIRNRDVR